MDTSRLTIRQKILLHDLPTDIRLVDAYNYWYEVVPAETKEMLELVHRIRYQVYCNENKFEPSENHRNNMEIDEYDFRSAHCLLIDRSNNQAAGTVRLILPDGNALATCFPTQQFCSRQLIYGRKIPLVTTAEVSRFAISRLFRNRVPERAGSSAFPVDRQALAPFITLGLIRGLVQMSIDHGITDWFAVMEPSLLRLLARFSIYFKPLGALIDYHGKRQPSHIRVNNLLDDVYRDKLEIWQVITNNGEILTQHQRQQSC
jgi:N-acyl amino acid synthase of PEP-CTERM/exosortase system